MHQAVQTWIDEMAQLTKPDRIVWIDGSEAERRCLTAEALRPASCTSWTRRNCPGAFCTARRRTTWPAWSTSPSSAPARRRTPARPTTGWHPAEAYAKLGAIFDGSMRGRTMYVIPYIMGIPGSPFSKVGIELTDSIYVVLNMRIMTRMGEVALRAARREPGFREGPALQGANSNPDRRFICHFPEDNTIWSVGSGYGGNVLLGKKCFCAAHRQLHGATGRLAGRAHADPGRGRSARARSPTWPAPSRAPAARPTWPC